jgi:DNA polymerase-3 subunit beta
MQLTILRDDLQKALQIVSTVVTSRTTYPMLGNLLLEAEEAGSGSERPGGGLVLKATDLDISVSTRVSAEVKKPGGIAIPAKHFQNIVRELPNAPVEVKVADEAAGRIQLKCAQGRYGLVGVPREEFPQFPVIKGQESLSLRTAMLEQAMRRVVFGVATDTTRPAMSGVLFQRDLERGELRLVATDGHRLARVSFPLGDASEKSTGQVGKAAPKGQKSAPSVSSMILSSKAINYLGRVLSDEDETIQMRFDESHAGFLLTNTTILSRLIEGPFPPYEAVIPKDNDKTVVVATAEFSAAIRRVSIFSETFTHQIQLQIKPGKMIISATTHDVGEGTDELSCEYSGPEISLYFNGSYLLDIVRNIESSQSALALKSPLSAALITPAEDGDKTLYLLMPIRLPE